MGPKATPSSGATRRKEKLSDFMYILKSLMRASVWMVAMFGLLEITKLITRMLALHASFNLDQPCQGSSSTMGPCLAARGRKMMALNMSERISTGSGARFTPGPVLDLMPGATPALPWKPSRPGTSFTPGPTSIAASGGALEAEKADSGRKAVQAKAGQLLGSSEGLAVRGLEVTALQAKAGTGPKAPALHDGKNLANSGDVSFHSDPTPESDAAAGSISLAVMYTSTSPPETPAPSVKQKLGSKKGAPS
ncbi:g6525 [Coccomyxa viridis]|uniref:G6525 protein n=1 Tax=Coccomyxa viridis TaxID=1274662 RepID=A0ABP1FY63_9CHLO